MEKNVMKYDCAIVGGGPAGLNAALVLGRAKRTVALLDSGKPRNRIAHESHGYLTRDRIKPGEFRKIAYEEVLYYPSVQHWQDEVVDIARMEDGFSIQLASGESVQARKLLLATGLREELPEIEGLEQFYGKTVFNCPFCDGWENRDRPLAVISSSPHIFHTVKLLYNWSKELYVCTNGKQSLDSEQIEEFKARGIQVFEAAVTKLTGQDGQLEQVHFADGTQISCRGGLIGPELINNSSSFAQSLGLETTEAGGIETSPFGKTTVEGVFAAGDSAYFMPAQLIHAASSGSKAAASILADLVEEEWEAAARN